MQQKRNWAALSSKGVQELYVTPQVNQSHSTSQQHTELGRSHHEHEIPNFVAQHNGKLQFFENVAAWVTEEITVKTEMSAVMIVVMSAVMTVGMTVGMTVVMTESVRRHMASWHDQFSMSNLIADDDAPKVWIGLFAVMNSEFGLMVVTTYFLTRGTS